MNGLFYTAMRTSIIDAVRGSKGSCAFEYWHEIGHLEIIFPSLEACYTQDGGPHHAETVFQHCMDVGDAISTKDWRLKLAAYLHDVGKPPCAKISAATNALRFRKHPDKGAELVKHELSVLGFNENTIEYISNLIRLHMIGFKNDFSIKATRRFMTKLRDAGINYRDWMRLLIADKKGNDKTDNNSIAQDVRAKLKCINALLKEENKFSIKDLAVNGRDVLKATWLEPGPEVGKILKNLYKDCVENPEHNNRSYLIDKIIKLGRNYNA